MESNVAETGSEIFLQTDDGLRLVLERVQGSGSGLAIGDKTFTLGSPIIRFEEVMEDPDAADLLGPRKASDWGMPESAVVENANGSPGSWIQVSSDQKPRPHTRIAVNQKEPAPLVLYGSCQSKVQGDAYGWWDRNLALNASVVYTDGTRMPEVSAYFGQYDHGPQLNKRLICPDRPIEHVDIDLTVPPGKCAAWYSDITLRPAKYSLYAPSTPPKRIDGTVQQEFDDRPSGLRGLVTYRPGPDCIEVRCSFESTKLDDRGVSAFLAIPFDAVGGLWHDDVRTSRRIEPGVVYRDQRWYGAGRDGYNSRYPFACVETADGHVLAIGTSVDEPRVFQTEYDAGKREFRIRFDIGMSPRAGRWANRGSFTAYLFTCMDGFRGAADKYQRMFAPAFENRVERQGIWLPFVSPLTVPEYQDFHFQFLESTGHMGWDETQGMYSLKYAEPWIHHHEFPPHIEGDEVHGPVVPSASIDLAKRLTAADDRSWPLDIRRRYPAYLGSYIEDQWGNPQGYFFRSPRGGRNENMMIVNPNDCLPPPPGAAFSSGGWDRNIIREAMDVSRQWHLPGWAMARVSEHPFLEVDDSQKASGKQSVRLDPVEGKSYFEQYLRGISQTIRYKGKSAEPLVFSYSARAEGVPENGTGFQWRVTFRYNDGTSSGGSFPLPQPGTEWQTYSHTVKPERSPTFVSVSLDSPTWTPDPTVLWIDQVSLKQGEKDLLENGNFEDAQLLPCRLDGVYLDTMECYLCNLNYRRHHWTYAEEPLTFDSARRPALHQVFSHVTFAKHMAEWMRPSGRLVFGNCTPVTPFAAPHLDVLGTEASWKPGGAWSPWGDAEFNFARFMSGTKPYCVLQYGNLTVEEQMRYVKRCLFYGVLPSNQAAPSGGWYWADLTAVDRHRPVFAKYLPVIIEVAQAGWRPLTFARSDDPSVWVERFGDGETFYLTVFNPTSKEKTTTITLDPRCGLKPDSKLVNAIDGKPTAWQTGHYFRVRLGPEDVGVYRVGDRRK